MSNFKSIRSRYDLLRRYILVVAAVWTVALAASLAWNIVEMNEDILEAARIQARVAYEKDTLSRSWSAKHGEIYVPVTEETPPNPYLSGMPERDITTPSGKLLTLMNPEYMMRQVHELAKEKHHVLGHLTSLDPINPENAPDPWEAEALKAFERGETEISSVEDIEGKRFMRLMGPLITRKSCLVCHAKQGYQEGDIRGGVSVSIPMEPLQVIARKQMFVLSLGHGLVWIIGLGGIAIGTRRFRQSEQMRKRAEEGRQKAYDELEKNIEELRRLNLAFKTLSESNQLLVRATHESDLLYEICRIIVQAGGYRLAWVGFAENDENKTVRPAAQMGFEEGYLETVNLTWADNEKGRGPTGRAIRMGKACILKNILTDPDYAPWRSEALKRGYASSIAFPLIADGKTLGALNIYSAEPDAFDTKEVNLLSELANDLAYGIMTLRRRAEHKQAEEEIKCQKVFNENVINALNFPFYVINLDYTIALTNEAAKKKGIIEGGYCYQLTHRLQKPCEGQHACPLQEVLRTRRAVQLEHLHYDREGNKAIVEVHGIPLFNKDGQIVQMIEFSIDITERKRIEEALKKLSSVVEQTADQVIVTNKDGVIEYVNPAFEKLTGYTKIEAVGKTPRILKSGKHDEKFYKAIWETILSGDVFTAEMINQKKNGDLYHTEKTITPIRDRQGNITHFVSTDKDITPRKEMEETQRLVELGRLVANMAHEVNNPLMVISGRAQLSLMEDIKNEEVKKNLGTIFEQSQRAKDIIQRLLKFSRPTKGELKKADINKSVEEIVAIVEHQFKLDNVQIRRNYAQNLPSLLIDEKQIQEVFMNLLTNARDAISGEGGIEIVTSREKNFVKIDIKDSGSGMDEETLSRIFEPFFTTKEKGTGLGLPICYSIVRDHGGELKFDSAPGRGTTATILLPVKESGANA